MAGGIVVRSNAKLALAMVLLDGKARVTNKYYVQSIDGHQALEETHRGKVPVVLCGFVGSAGSIRAPASVITTDFAGREIETSFSLNISASENKIRRR